MGKKKKRFSYIKTMIILSYLSNVALNFSARSSYKSDVSEEFWSSVFSTTQNHKQRSKRVKKKWINRVFVCPS